MEFLTARLYWAAPQNRTFWAWFSKLSRLAQLTVGVSEKQWKPLFFGRYPPIALCYQFYMLFSVYKERNMPVDSVKVVIEAPQMPFLAPQFSQKSSSGGCPAKQQM